MIVYRFIAELVWPRPSEKKRSRNTMRDAEHGLRAVLRFALPHEVLSSRLDMYCSGDNFIGSQLMSGARLESGFDRRMAQPAARKRLEAILQDGVGFAKLVRPVWSWRAAHGVGQAQGALQCRPRRATACSELSGKETVGCGFA